MRFTFLSFAAIAIALGAISLLEGLNNGARYRYVTTSQYNLENIDFGHSHDSLTYEEFRALPRHARQKYLAIVNCAAGLLESLVISPLSSLVLAFMLFICAYLGYQNCPPNRPAAEPALTTFRDTLAPPATTSDPPPSSPAPAPKWLPRIRQHRQTIPDDAPPRIYAILGDDRDGVLAYCMAAVEQVIREENSVVDLIVATEADLKAIDFRPCDLVLHAKINFYAPGNANLRRYLAPLDLCFGFAACRLNVKATTTFNGLSREFIFQGQKSWHGLDCSAATVNHALGLIVGRKLAKRVVEIITGRTLTNAGAYDMARTALVLAITGLIPIVCLGTVIPGFIYAVTSARHIYGHQLTRCRTTLTIAFLLLTVQVAESIPIIIWMALNAD